MSAISLAARSSSWISISDLAFAACIDCSSEMYHRLVDGPLDATKSLPPLWGDVPKNPAPAARGDCPDEWNLSHPDLVQQVPQAYVDAGSRIVLTNTFRANRPATLGEVTGR